MTEKRGIGKRDEATGGKAFVALRGAAEPGGTGPRREVAIEI